MIVNFDDKNYDKLLNQLISSQHWYPPMYKQKISQYYREISLSKGKKVEDKSFVLVWENKPVCGFIGAIVEDSQKHNLIEYEVPCIIIENIDKMTKKAGKSFLDEFEKIIEVINGSIWYRDYLIDGELSILSRHLLSKGAKPTSIFSQVIDLYKDEVILKRNIRKSYGSLISWGRRELQPKVYDNSNMTWEKMLAFIELHTRVAGRKTRSNETWRRQFEFIQEGGAFVIYGHFNGELVSAGYFSLSDSNCHYGFSASIREHFDKPLFHVLMWNAILHAKKIGRHWFEVGEQLYPNHPSDPVASKKELGISTFKAGFGGRTRAFMDLKLDLSIFN